MIKETTKTAFPKDVTHKPLKPPVSENPRLPSPPAAEDEMEIEEEEEEQHSQQLPAAHAGTGLTGAPDRSDRSWPEQHSHKHKPTSPIKKFISLLTGMCKSQRDIEVEQQR